MDFKKLKKRKNKTVKKVEVGLKRENCGLNKCTAGLMRMSRWYGLCPLEGLNAESTSGLRFEPRTIYSLYSIFTYFGMSSMTIIAFWSFLKTDLSLTMLDHFYYYFTLTISSLLYLWLCRSWPRLMRDVTEIEGQIKGFKLSGSIRRTILMTSVVMFILGLVEYLCRSMYRVSFSMSCLQQFEFTYPVVKLYFKLKVVQVIRIGPLSLIFGIIFEFTSVQVAFLWSFLDIFIYAIGSYFNGLFKEYNGYIKTEKNNVNADWKHLRLQYSNLVVLVNKVVSHINVLVLMSFTINIFRICYQLYNILKIHVPFKSKLFSFDVCNIHSLNRNHQSISRVNDIMMTAPSTHMRIILGTLITYELVLLQIYYSTLIKALEDEGDAKTTNHS